MVATFFGVALKRILIVAAIALLALVPVQGVFLYRTAAAETGTWIDGNMPQLTVNEIGSPASDHCYDTVFKIRSYRNTNGAFLPGGRDVNINVCVQSSNLGLISNTGHVKIGEYAYKIVNSAGGSAPLSVDPNTGTAYLTVPTPSSGPSSFMSWPDTVLLSGVTERQNFDEVTKLKPNITFMEDSNGNRLFKMPPGAFSNNGRWMVFYVAGVGLVRADLLNHQVLLFDNETYSYDLGFHPSIELAITDDGNTVIRSGIGMWARTTKVYDLSGCTGAPFAVGPVNPTPGCRGRSVHQEVVASNPGYVGMTKMRFTTDGKVVRGVADFLKPGNIHEYRHVTLAVAGYEVQNTKYLALGDSFSSGEGAYEYLAGTDLPDINKCHTSTLSYSYLAAQALSIDGPTFHNMACSGARTINYFAKEQYNVTNNFVWLPGEERQYSYVTQADPEAVTISMIGNDIGFSDKITQCLNPFSTCFHFKEERQAVADEIYGKFDAMVSMYEHIQRKSSGARVYVVGYPQILDETAACLPNAPFSSEEVQMARGMVTYLNSVIKAAAQYAGVQYIEVENAFSGYELCRPLSLETGLTTAVNGLTAGDDIGLLGVNVVGNESFHPNVLGHQLMSQALLAQSENLTKPMPVLPGAVDPSVIVPYVSSAPYNAFISNAPSNGLGYKVGTYVNLKTDDENEIHIILRDSPTHISDTELNLQPNVNFDAVLYSTPTPLGTVPTNADGHIDGNITVPGSVEPGFHTLRLTGKDLGGRDVQLYKTIYVAANALDYDGDDTLNVDEECLAVQPAGTDQDRDDIDDACDPVVNAEPADSEPPVVTGTPDREANENGWYNSDVTINWTATDPDPSSGAPTQPPATLANQEGAHTYVSDLACDPLDNCATGSLEVSIDKTAPQISYTLSQAANAQGWNNSAVTVTFACSDETSGVDSCSEPQTVSGADGVYVVTGSVTDKAGNTNGVNVFVSLDSTLPTVSQSVLPATNSEGWHNTDVTVTPTCDDNLSAILSCSPVVILSTEGANQTVESTAEDNAGNTATATVSLNIDKTAPVLGAAIWSNNPKSVLGTASLSLSATDSLSGVAEAEYYLGDTDPGQGNGATMQVGEDGVSVGFNTDFPTGVYKVTVRAKDKAGNWSQPVTDYLVVYDPFGTRMTGKKSLLPSLTNGDVLPGLINSGQEDKAKFGFNVRYTDDGSGIHPHSDFQFKYETGSKCNKPAQAVNCHSFELNATSIAWLVTEGVNDSTGLFQGTATLNVDGTATNVVFRLTGLDGERLDPTSQDRLTLKVYAAGDNPNNAASLYTVSAEVLRGNIKIRTW